MGGGFKEMASKKVPAVNPEQLRQRYREERDKRLHAQNGVVGQKQYLNDLHQSERWVVASI